MSKICLIQPYHNKMNMIFVNISLSKQMGKKHIIYTCGPGRPGGPGIPRNTSPSGVVKIPGGPTSPFRPGSPFCPFTKEYNKRYSVYLCLLQEITRNKRRSNR